jgi:hypothetical protein
MKQVLYDFYDKLNNCASEKYKFNNYIKKKHFLVRHSYFVNYFSRTCNVEVCSIVKYFYSIINV